MKQTFLAFMVGFFLLLLATPLLASETKQSAAQDLVDKATIVVNSFSADPDLDWFRKKVPEAKALLIIPQELKGAFLIGGSGGSGVLIARDEKTNEWGSPAFYSMGSLSIGFQAGGTSSEIILMIMSEKALDGLLTSSLKLGADITIAAGPIGGGTTAQIADILSYSRSKGAFAGMSLDGAVVTTRGDLNEAYYGEKVSPADILVRKEVTSAQADALRIAVQAVTAKK